MSSLEHGVVLQRPQTAPTAFYSKSPLVLKNEELWRNKVRHDIKLSSALINESDRSIYVGKCHDPLTNLRDVLRTLSNTEAFRYMRQCRLIVAKLRKCWVDVNEEIKTLSKNREYLESTIDHVRKDVLINQETIDNRQNRPASEPNPDTVDVALASERQGLLAFKKNLETILKPIQEHLQKLAAIRESVSKLCKERSVVTDLICQCLTQSMRSYDRTVTAKQTTKTSLYDPSKNLKSRANAAISSSQLFGESSSEVAASDKTFQVGPLSAFTEESLDIIKEAMSNIFESIQMRNQSKLAMRDSLENIKMLNASINESFMRKIEETLSLNKHLLVSSADTQLAVNRAVRWNDLTNITLKYTLGPDKSSNLLINERLDRPIIKTFQKHPGNQVPEAQETQKGTDALKESEKNTQKHIKTLKVIGKRLDANSREKEAQFNLDKSLLRRRRELSDHRWVPAGYIK